MVSKHKLQFVKSQIEEIKNNDLYRELRYGQVNGAHITIQSKKFLNFCSNDYLGIPPSTISKKQMQSSSRLVSGNDDSYLKLEKKLAKHKSQKNSLIFPTGYMANLGAISTIIQKGDLVLSDSLNHASIIEACKLSQGKISIYSHNDMAELSSKIKKSKKRKFIITEGIFSMDGDFAKLDEISEIAQKNDAALILDDAHGDFTVGNDGRGSANHYKVDKKIDLYISSLSKGLGSFGGYVAASNEVTDYLINKSKTFIYTSALPSVLVNHALQRFSSKREPRRKKLASNVRQFIKGLRDSGFEINSDSHIIPIMIGNEKKALEFGSALMKEGIFAQPIRYPTVAKNRARIRASMTAWITKNQIAQALDSFEKLGKKFGII